MLASGRMGRVILGWGDWGGVGMEMKDNVGLGTVASVA